MTQAIFTTSSGKATQKGLSPFPPYTPNRERKMTNVTVEVPTLGSSTVSNSTASFSARPRAQTKAEAGSVDVGENEGAPPTNTPVDSENTPSTLTPDREEVVVVEEEEEEREKRVANVTEIPTTPKSKRRTRRIPEGLLTPRTPRTPGSNATGENTTPSTRRVTRSSVESDQMPSMKELLEASPSRKRRSLNQEVEGRHGNGALTKIPAHGLPTPSMPSRIVDVLEGEGEGKEEGRPQPQGPAQVYQQARMALRLSSTASSLGPVLVGRDEERKKMTGFLRKHLVDQTSGAMYVSGQPGAGKTALLSEILVHLNQGDEEELASFRWATLNCMSFTDGTEVYKQILRSLQIPFDMDRIEREGGKVMEESFVGERRRVHFILGLDEVDQLLTISPSTLHHLFGLTARRHSRLILVGIANDLNMTDRLLPELQGQGCHPELLHFAPYTAKETVPIVRSRLEHLREPVILPTALELAARKVAASSGDCRRVLEVCRRSVELAEAEWRAKGDGEHPVIQAKATHVLKVLARVTQDATRSIRTLPLQGKVTLVALVLWLQKRQAGEVGMSALYSGYVQLCQQHRLVVPVTRSEFGDLISGLESAGGLIEVRLGSSKGRPVHRIGGLSGAKGGEARIALIALRKDILRAVGDVGILQSLVG